MKKLLFMILFSGLFTCYAQSFEYATLTVDNLQNGVGAYNLIISEISLVSASDFEAYFGRTFPHPFTFGILLNTLGQEGWELVGTNAVSGTLYFFFKRIL